MNPSSETLRSAIIRRAARATTFLEGANFDVYRADSQKRSACEMAVIVSGTALATLRARGEMGDDDAVKRVIALGAELEADTADHTGPEKSWQAVTVDLPHVAAAIEARG